MWNVKSRRSGLGRMDDFYLVRSVRLLRDSNVVGSYTMEVHEPRDMKWTSLYMFTSVHQVSLVTIVVQPNDMYGSMIGVFVTRERPTKHAEPS